MKLDDAGVLFSRYSSFWEDKRYCDFTIRCRGRSWDIHRILLAAHSPVFERMFSSGFKEAESGEADLSDDNPELIGNMIKFLYSLTLSTGGTAYTIDGHTEQIGRCDSEYPGLKWHQDRLLSDARLYALADKYGIEALSTYIEKDFENSLSYLSYHMHCTDLKRISKITATVYEGTPNIQTRLRTLLLSFFEANNVFIFERESLRAYARMNPEFMTAFTDLCARASPLVDRSLFWCKKCRTYARRRGFCSSHDNKHEFADACPES